MTITLKPRSEIKVPTSILRKAGYRPGDQIDFKVSGQTITIAPKLPAADDEYTPRQRRMIDARLAKAEEDIKAGRVHGPFTAKQAAVFVERLAKERAAKKTTRSRR
jgi:antitoxin component of MazEF toxin-antitoxin module